MPRLIWTQPALRDLRRLHDFLVLKNPDAAIRAAMAIRKRVNSLEKHPQIGRPAEDIKPGCRELVIEFGQGGYVVRYQFDAEWVVILSIRHGREDGY